MKKYFNKISEIVIKRLNISIDNKEKYYQYIEKLTNVIIGAVFTIISCILIYFVELPNTPASQLKRPESGTQSVILEVTNEEGLLQKVDIDIGAVVYTQEEAILNLNKADEYIRNNILSTEAQKSNSITQDIMLVKKIPEYNVEIDWYPSDYAILGSNGRVYNESFEDNQKEAVRLTASCKCQGYTKEFIYEVIVCAPVLDENARNQKLIVDAILEADNTSKYENYVELPAQIDGKKVKYSILKNSNVITVFVIGIIVTIMLVINVDAKRKKEKENREKQLTYSYSEVVSKLTLLLGAGMSISMSWEKLVKDYLNSNSYKKQYAYEEMKIAYYKMKSGTSQAKAYLDFGKSCGTKEYIKLGSLLEQNLIKGTKGLSKLLKEEVENAFTQRKNLAFKLGEEAGTKLLAPMIIMLVIVMAIIMIPAMMSFSI